MPPSVKLAGGKVYVNLLTMIATTMNRVQEHTTWDKNLQLLSLAYNTSVHAETKEIPFFPGLWEGLPLYLGQGYEAVCFTNPRFVQAKDAI